MILYSHRVRWHTSLTGFNMRSNFAREYRVQIYLEDPGRLPTNLSVIHNVPEASLSRVDIIICVLDRIVRRKQSKHQGKDVVEEVIFLLDLVLEDFGRRFCPETTFLDDMSPRLLDTATAPTTFGESPNRH